MLPFQVYDSTTMSFLKNKMSHFTHYSRKSPKIAGEITQKLRKV